MAILNIPNVQIPKVNGTITFDFDLPDSIIAGQPFPDAAFANGAIKLAEVNASASKNIDFGTGDRKVSFGANGGGHAAVGVYRTTKNLFKDLAAAGLSDEVADLLGFSIDPADNLIAIRWGYDLGANVNSMVLGSPVKVSVGASAKKDGLYAVLHAVARTRGARLSITDGLKAWRLPPFIRTVDDIEPKTTLISEIGGSLGVNLGVEYGYSYSWTKEAAKLGALEGDIGLKINAGIKGQLGYQTEGLFSVAISRESTARRVRLRVYRLKQKSTNIGFNAGFDFQFEAPDSLFPERFEDFLKGVFNLQESQVLNDFFAWADSDEPIDQLLGPQLHK
ncbi:MAG: hypothetical protein OEM82_16360, partial [Acidobacteriota bacterium]|nr:hypothetical protein [Acidobacteriota bacterium]